MRRKLGWIGLLFLSAALSCTLIIGAFTLILRSAFDSYMTSSYLKQSRTPSVAEIEETARMKLPKGYINLKSLFYSESRDEAVSMRVKLSANRSEIKKVLSAAGFYSELTLNPEWRSVTNGGIKIPWWNPDAEKNVLSGSHEIEPSTGKQAEQVWKIYMLVAQKDNNLDTLYLEVTKYDSTKVH
jgi:hypothetical protein